MPKRRPRGRSTQRQRPVQRRSPGSRGPRDAHDDPGVELVDQLDAALDHPEPLVFLECASMFAAVLADPSDAAGRPQLDPQVFLVMLDETDTAATDALLAALAVLIPDIVPPRIARHDLPAWLVRLPEAQVTAAASVVDVLRDADNLMIEVTLADRSSVTLVALVDHNLGSIVKDVFVLPDPLSHVLKDMSEFASVLTAHDEHPADIAARLRESVVRTDAFVDPPETETWPASRPLLEWALRLIGPGGTGWDFAEHTDAELNVLVAEVAAAGVLGPEARDVLTPLLAFAATTATHDPLRWSPTSVEVLFMDWLPRNAPAGPRRHDQVATTLQVLVQLAHARRGVPAAATRETLQAIHLWSHQARQATEPGPLDPPEVRAHELRIQTLRREAGGITALDTLKVGKLPKIEPLQLGAVPEDVRPIVADIGRLVDTAMMELFGDIELRTAARRILACAMAADPSVVRRASNMVPIAAAVTWIAAKANDAFVQPRVLAAIFGDPGASATAVRVKDLAEHFGLKGSPSARATPILTALGRSWADGNSRDLGDPELLTSTRRKGMIRQRDMLRVFGD